MRVLVSRARPEAERTAASLRAHGHDAVVGPVLRIVASTAAPPPGPYDAVLATSAHAFAGAPSGLGLRDRPLYAVGDITGAAARQAGFRDVRISQGNGADLASLLALTLPRPARLLYLCGRDRKPVTEETLGSAGYALACHEAYVAEAEAAWPDEVIEAFRTGSLDGALHYSRRSASLALGLAEGGGVAAGFLGLAHFCLSDDVAGPLRAAGAMRIAVAARPEEARLMALLADRT